jgi:chemotaxis protein histidine kinase CheA
MVPTSPKIHKTHKILPADFRLQAKIGGPAVTFMGPGVYQKAQSALEAVLPELTTEVERLMNALALAVRHREDNTRDAIWKIAHDLRGLAGTAQRESLGVAADLICRYLDGTDEAFKADPSVLSTIAVVALQAVKEGADRDPMINMLLTDCAQAVTVQRRREGRDTPD